MCANKLLQTGFKQMLQHFLDVLWPHSTKESLTHDHFLETDSHVLFTLMLNKC